MPTTIFATQVFYRVRRGKEREEELAAESPAEALPEIVRFVEQMLSGRGYDLVNPVVVEGEDPDSSGTSSRRASWRRRARPGRRVPANIAAALENLTEIHDYLVADRRPL